MRTPRGTRGSSFRFRVSGRYATSEAHAVCALSAAETFLSDLGPCSDTGDHHTFTDQINLDPMIISQPWYPRRAESFAGGCKYLWPCFPCAAPISSFPACLRPSCGNNTKRPGSVQCASHARCRTAQACLRERAQGPGLGVWDVFGTRVRRFEGLRFAGQGVQRFSADTFLHVSLLQNLLRKVFKYPLEETWPLKPGRSADHWGFRFPNA